jgi:hypothetical protein
MFWRPSAGPGGRTGLGPELRQFQARNRRLRRSELPDLAERIRAGQVPQQTVWPVAIVVVPPRFKLLPGIVQCHELVDVLTLVAQTRVERLYVLDQFQLKAVTDRTVMVALVSVATTNDQFLTWGWRVLFLVSVIVALGGYAIRRGVEESPQFVRDGKVAHGVVRVPLFETLVQRRRSHRRAARPAACC